MLKSLKAIWAASLLGAGALIGVPAAPVTAQPDLQTTRIPAPSIAPPLLSPALLNGKPFPEVRPFVAKVPEPRRTLFVAAGAENGDGSEAHPWGDLQASLCALEPGDRLRVRAGKYPGSFQIDTPCRDGSAQAPIQVFFDGKATLLARGESSPLTIRKAHWHMVGVYLKCKNSLAAGISVDGPGAHDLTLDGTRVSDGAGPGVRIGAQAARITIANSRISKTGLKTSGNASVGIEIEAGTQNILLANNHLHENPLGSVRVDPPESGGHPSRNLVLRANTIRNDGTTSIDVAAADGLTATGNTISDAAGRPRSRGILLEEVRDAVVRGNHVSQCTVGIQVGRGNPDDGSFRAARNVAIDHNYLERTLPAGVACDIEAGSAIRLTNNIVDGYSTGILLFGKPPQTEKVTVANNLVLGVSDVAFLIADPAATTLFDFNIFRPLGPANVEVSSQTISLAQYLKDGAMPHTRLSVTARILGRDLGRVSGVATLHQGKALDGADSHGSAPNIGVTER
jgi:hypothetical protein